MRRNFSITSTIELASQGQSYDLHNDFDAIKVELDIANNLITIFWRSLRCQNALASIRFEGLQSLALKGFDISMPREEDRRLSFMGYLHPDDVEIMDGFLPEEGPMKDSPMIFCFEGGLAIKVFAISAEFRKSK